MSEIHDPVVEANRELLLQRSQLGIKKYGTTLADANLTRRQITQHALEEALDLANYLQADLQILDRAPTIGEQPTADQQAAGSVEAERERFMAWVKEDRIPPGRRDHHWKTWCRALTGAEHSPRLGSEVPCAALDSRAQPVAQPVAAGELPPHSGMIDFVDELGRVSHQRGWTADQMRAYGQQCAATRPAAVDGVRWDLFPSYLIDHLEGEPLSEHLLQHALADMLRDPNYLAACSASAVQSAPDDMVLMPKSPSEAILAPEGWPRMEYARYQAMLAAAQPAPTEKENHG